MFTHLSDTTKAVVFYALALALALGAALIPGATTGPYAFTPLLAVLLMLLVVTRDGYTRAGWAALGLHRLGLRAWPAALLIPLVVMSVAYGVLWISGLATVVMPSAAETQGLPVAVFLPVGIVITLIQATLTTSLGEELGWRGYLLPRLAHLGAWRAALLTGLLHGIWHLPIMLLTTQYHPDANRAIFIPLFLLSTTIAGLFFAYLRFSSESVWPAALGHTAHNLFWAMFALFTRATSPTAVEYLASDAGILIAAGYALGAGWLMLQLTRHAQVSSATREPTPDTVAP